MVMFNSYVKLPEGKDHLGRFKASAKWMSSCFCTICTTGTWRGRQSWTSDFSCVRRGTLSQQKPSRRISILRAWAHSAKKTCCVTISWLVVSNMNGLFYIIFHFIYGMSSFPLTHIFFKMVIAPHWIILNPCGIFQRDSRYIYFEEQVVMSKESTKCRNAQQELNFCHKRRQKTFPEHPESDGWAMQRPHHKKHTQWLLGTCSNIFHQKTVDVAHRVAPQRLV